MQNERKIIVIIERETERERERAGASSFLLFCFVFITLHFNLCLFDFIFYIKCVKKNTKAYTKGFKANQFVWYTLRVDFFFSQFSEIKLLQFTAKTAYFF